MRCRPLLAGIAALLLAGCAGSPFRAARSDALPLQAFAALQQRAALAYAEGDAATATALYAQMVRSAPGDAQAWRRLGNLELMAGHPQHALLAYEHALRLGGGDVALWHNIAVIRVRQAQAALAQVRGQPLQPGQRALREDSARAARVLLRVFPQPSAAPAASTGAAAGTAQGQTP